MMRLLRRMPRISAILSVSVLTACGGISQPANVNGLTQAIGDDLPGAQGLTEGDQVKIDVTVARGCASGVFAKELCDRHTDASAERFRTLNSGLVS